VAENDISWKRPEGAFNLRAAAVITRGGDVLLCTVEGLGYWFLPGGRVRLGEPGAAALARELAEELGHDLPAGELALVVENIYAGGTLQHEIGLYYQVSWPDALDDQDLHRGAEPGHAFRWAPLAGLGSVRFEPAGLVSVLQDLPDRVGHVLLDGQSAVAQTRVAPPATSRITPVIQEDSSDAR
jgi:ADP-ribose pyrophosphatase YjhB (NUDIX family)